jgi:hypothetical protein
MRGDRATARKPERITGLPAHPELVPAHRVHAMTNPKTDSEPLATATEHQSHTALERIMLRRRDDVDFDAVRMAAEPLRLSEHRIRRLYLSLCQARTEFDMMCLMRATPKDSAVLSWLNKIEQSIWRIAKEVKKVEPQFTEACSLLAREGEKWAAEQDPEIRDRLGFRRCDLGDGLYGASEAFDRWFETTPVVLKALREAQGRLRPNPNQVDKGRGDKAAKQWLCGMRLPDIYKRFSGRDFGITKDGDRVMETTGVAFVNAALQAIGLERLSPETIKSHEYQQRRGRRQG